MRKPRRQEDVKLRERVTKLEAGLVTYGDHVTGCTKKMDRTKVCSCGFDDLLHDRE